MVTLPGESTTRHFQAFLREAGLSSVSVKNYVSDIRQFLIGEKIENVYQITRLKLSEYLSRIERAKPEATYRRHLASVRRFVTFLSIEYRINLGNVIPEKTTSVAETNINSSLTLYEKFKLFLQKEKKSDATIKNYLSDVNHFLHWSANLPAKTTKLSAGRPINHLSEIITSEAIKAFFHHLKLTKTSTSVINRRESSLRKLAQFCLDANLISHNPFEKSISLPSLTSLLPLDQPQYLIKPDQTTHPIKKILLRYTQHPLTPYLHLSLLLLFASALGIFGYRQIISDAPQPQAYPAAPVRPKRALSFQSRLTDPHGAPINETQTAVFRLWNTETDGQVISCIGESGENCLYSASCQITPDQDGVFSAQIGSGQCGAEIDSSVFSENQSVFMEITVGGQTLTPRQPIATAAYALNTETLQGYPASASATENTVPLMNSDGDLVLGSTSPSIVSTSGTFALKGQTLTLTTETGSDGDINLAPDGRGSVNLMGNLDKGIFLDITDANMTTGTLIEGYVANNSRTGTLLHLASGTKQINRLTISTTGQTDIIADTYTKGALNVIQTGTGPIFLAKNGKTAVAELKKDGTLNLLGGLALNYPISTPVLPGQLLMNASTKGQAALIINQNDSQGDLFTASRSGVTTFVIDNQGHVGIGGMNKPPYQLTVNGISSTSRLQVAEAAVAGGVVWTDNAGFLSSIAGSSGQCLTSGGSGEPVWTSCSSAASNFWQRNNGALTPINITDDLLLGATATTSAFVKLTGTSGNNSWVNTGNFGIGTTSPGEKLDVAGSATISGNLTFYGGARTIASRNMTTLAIGDSQTGNIVLAPGGTTALTAIVNDVTIADVLTVTGDTAINGGDLTTTTSTFNLINATATTVNLAGAATTLNIAPTGASGSIVFSGGSADTGCTLDGTTGNLTCSGNITGGSTGIQGYWQRIDGSVAPTNISDSINIGAVATASAFVHLAGTPGENSFVNTANFGVGDTSPDAKLEVSSTTEQLRLTYTDNTVDSRFTVDSSGDLTINNTGTQTIIADDLQVQGGDLTTNQTTFNLVNTTATTLNLGGVAGTFNIGPTGATATSINIAGGSGATGCTVDGATGNLTCSANITATGDLAANGGDLTTTTSTFNLINATATTVNLAGAATTLNIAPTGASGSIVFSGGSADTGCTLDGTTGNLTCSGNITSSGTGTPTVGFWTRNTSSGFLYPSTITDRVSIGTTSPLATLDARSVLGTIPVASISGVTSMAALIVDQSGIGDIFTASFAGMPKVIISSAGNLEIKNQGDLRLYDADNSNFTGFQAPSLSTDLLLTLPSTTGSLGYVLATDGSGVLSWTDPNFAASGSIFWNQANGLLFPKNSTVDVTIGGQSTESAKFAFINVLSGNPTASISGNLAITSPTSSNPATTFDILNGGTLNLRTSVGGNSGLASRLFVTNSGRVGIGNTAPIESLDLVGNATFSGNLTFYGDARTIASRNMTTLTIGDSQTGNVILAPGGTTALTAISDDAIITDGLTVGGDAAVNGGDLTTTASAFNLITTNATTVNFASAGTIVNIGPTGTTTTSINFAGGAGVTGCTIAGATGNLTCDGDIAVNGGDLTTTQTTFNLVNATATTVNFAGAATTLNIAPTGASGTISLSGGSADTGCTLDGTTGNLTCSGDVTGASSGTQGYWQRNSNSLSPSNITDDVLLGATSTASALIKFTGTPSNNSWINTGRFGVGTTSPLATFDARTNLGTIPAASISGATSMAALIVDNSGVGDIFTASSSGLNRFVIKQSGNVGVATTTPSYLFTVQTSKSDYLASIYNTGTAIDSAGLIIRTDGNGNLLTLNASGSDIVTISPTQTTVNNPAVFTSPGDVSIAYDLIFTNPTASFIKSAAPLTIASGETFNNDNLTLQTYGTGGVVISPANTTTTTSGTSTALSVAPDLTSATNSLAHTLYGINSTPTINETGTGVAVSNLYNIYTGLTKTAGTITNYYGNYIAAPTGAGTITNTYALVTEATAGNIGIGTTTPTGLLDVTGTSDTTATFTLTNNTATTIGAGIDTLGVIDIQSSSLITGNLINVEANALTTGKALNISTTSTALANTTTGSLINLTASGNPAATWTGSLGLIEYVTSTDADIDGSVLRLGITGAGAGDGTVLNLTSAQTGSSAYILRINDDGTYTDSTPTIIDPSGRVGIGNTTPLATLDVRANLGTIPAASVSGITSMAALIVDNSYNSDIFTASSSGASRLRLASNADLILYGQAGNSSAGRFYPNADAIQDLGIATNNEWRNLHLSNAINRGGVSVVNLATQTLGDQGGGFSGWVIEKQASISGTLGTTQLVVPGQTFLGCTLATCNNAGSAVMVAGNFGDGKIDVGTVDPPYTINGEKYATYLPGMIGQKEEVAGNLNTNELVPNVGYKTTIDFSNLPKASDLWLFAKVTDLKKHIRDLAVILTPGSGSRAWYEIDPEKMQLTIYTSKPTLVSFRFTAPRFDSESWANTREEGTRGFLINDPDEPSNNLNNETLVALDPVFTENNINQYELTINNSLISEIGSYANLLVANLRSGLVKTDKLISPLVEVDTIIVNDKLISPLAEIDTLESSTISTETVAADDATISGTLYAADIESPAIDNLRGEIAGLSENYATASSILAAIKAKYGSFDSLLNPSSQNDSLATNTLSSQNATISGEYALYTQPVIIADNILVNSTLLSNSLNSNDGILYLQPTGESGLNLLAGLMTLTPDGQVTINGDLRINGTLYANNTVTNEFSTQTATISGQLVLGKEISATPFGQLVSLFNNNGDLVGSIDASGAASFNRVAGQEILTSGLIIAAPASASADASSSATLSTNATIGTATIPAGQTEIFISNFLVKSGTYVYLTPISDTNNQVLYLKSKWERSSRPCPPEASCEGGFTVAISQPLITDVTFNYWLIQTQP